MLPRTSFLALLFGCCLCWTASSQQSQAEAVADSSDSRTCGGLPCELKEEDGAVSSGATILEAADAKPPSEERNVLPSEGEVNENVFTSNSIDSPAEVEDKETGSISFPSALNEDTIVLDEHKSDGTDSHEGDEAKTVGLVENEVDSENAPNTALQDEIDSPSLQVIGMQKEADSVDSEHGGSETSATPTPAKRRLFPFLHTSLFSTFKTLLRSVLFEFVEENASQESAANSSEWSNQSSMAEDEDIVKETNATSNGTDAVRRTRFQCAIKNVTTEDVGKVKIVNSTELLDILSLSKSQKSSACVLVMFYAPWCHFCAQTAPHYNALARAFPQLDVLAVDTSHFSYLNARFGTVAVPNVMLFHARSAVRFNHTSRVLDKFTQFVTNNTGLEPRRFVLLEPLDFVGPLPCVVRRGRDWLLWVAWVFVATCTAYGFVCSQYGQGFIARLKVLWQEHQHID